MSPPDWVRGSGLGLCAAASLALFHAAGAGAEAAPYPGLATTSCQVQGLGKALCADLTRPLDPARPSGPQIKVHVVIKPAVGRHKAADPVFFLAGGPGQSAASLSGMVAPSFKRLNNRRDLVFVDQRGTGQSAPLICETPRARSLATSIDDKTLDSDLDACLAHLKSLPHGDLRFYTTTIAMQDLDAVRAAMGAEQVNLVGVSYGTRAGLEYQRQFPARVRRQVIDGVAPPDMALPYSIAQDMQLAFDALLQRCEKDEGCQQRHPQLRARWATYMGSLPRKFELRHPVTGRIESLDIRAKDVLGWVRPPLYVPALSAALPQAMEEAMAGRPQALFTLGASMGSGKAGSLSMGMHFSVVCAEDYPRLPQLQAPTGTVFLAQVREVYDKACARWPKGQVDPAYYQIPAAQAPVLLLSGGADPVTPPVHAARAQKALGPKTVHLVAPNLGHGLMTSATCATDAIQQFISAESDTQALAVKASCLDQIPAPPDFIRPGHLAGQARKETP